MQTRFTEQVGIEHPMICGAMYPCSTPNLVAAASEAGAIGIVQPLAFTYVHGYDFREALVKIKQMTKKPWGVNIIVESSSRAYIKRMERYIDIALEEGCRFFITALGNARFVVEKVKPYGAIVYHDVTELKWAEKAISYGVDGLICVNNRAGGHAGVLSMEELYQELVHFGLPLVCAGGVGDAEQYCKALELGYAAVQMGTRFIATKECSEAANYKEAIIRAKENDIVLTERVTGIPLSVIKTPYVEAVGTQVGGVSRFLLRCPYTKKWMRLYYGLLALRRFRLSSIKGGSSSDYWQAGKSVEGIDSIETVQEVVESMNRSLKNREGRSC